jgi:O-antigen/teichoic acid export membrane protein
MFVAILAAVYQAIGRPEVPARALGVVAVTELLALLFVVPRWGSVGAAAVFVSATLVALIALSAWFVRGAGAIDWPAAARWLIVYVVGLVAGGGSLVLARVLVGNFDIALIVAALVYLATVHIGGILRGPIVLIASRTTSEQGQEEDE